MEILPIAIGYVIFVILLVFPLWRIFGRTGMNPMLALFLLIPVMGALICVLILALGRWPAIEPDPDMAG